MGTHPWPQDPSSLPHPPLTLPCLHPHQAHSTDRGHLPAPVAPSLVPATWRALCHCAASCRIVSGPRRSQLAAWKLERPAGGTTLLVPL